MKHRSEAGLHDEGICILALVGSSCVSLILLVVLVPTVNDVAAVAVALAAGITVFILDGLSARHNVER